MLHRGQLYKVGQSFRQPALAATLARLASAGVEDFYRGQIARLIAADHQRHGGLITLADLAAVEPPAPCQPISNEYRGRRIVSAAPPAGGLQLLVGLRLLERLLGAQGIDEAHWYEMLGETTQAVFREREQSSRSNEDCALTSCQQRLADERIESLAHTIGDAQVAKAPHCENDPIAMSDDEEPGETTHLCTADAQGNVVSLTQSIQSLFGARAGCVASGFLYNNYLVTCPRDAHPHQLRGGCRPRSNSAPTLILPAREDEALAEPESPRSNSAQSILALGAAGSRRTTSALLHVVSGIIDRGRSLAQAVDAPRLHVKLSRNAWVERSPLTEALLERFQLRFRKIKIRSRHSYAMGCVQAIQIGPDGQRLAVADPRREGTGQIVQRS
jgi:gamma-glutamyltranspeptidase/glutathione hydrolase